MLFIPRFYPITDLILAGRPSHFEIVMELVTGGAKFIQVREKHLSSRDLYTQLRRATDFCRKHNVKIIVNDRVDLALATDADGVHLGQDDFPVEEARKLLGRKKIIGLSTHNLRQAIKADMTSADYVAIGPIFQSSSKATSNPPLQIGIIKSLRPRIHKPIVAIGGITLSRVAEVLSAGADSIAVISDLYRSGNLTERTRLFIAECANSRVVGSM